MATIATTIRITEDLQDRYNQLAQATGHTREYLMAEALERYAAREGWQIKQTRASLATLEAGALDTTDLDDLIAKDLASGEITQEDLDEAYTRYGVESQRIPTS